MRLRLRHKRYRLPFRQPVRTAQGLWPAREGILLRLEAASGEIGYGEIAPIPWFGGASLDQIEGTIASLGEWTTPTLLREALLVGAARFGLESALGELAPPAPLLGPDTLQVCALLPAGRAVFEAVQPRLEAGFRVFKWKVGVGDVADELGMLDDLLGRLPVGAKLRLDANGAWDRRGSERWLERLADRPIEFLEQPVAANARGSRDLLLGLAADYPTLLALDESIVKDDDVESWLDLGWPGAFVLKPALLSDPDALAARLAQRGAPLIFSSALETAVGAYDALRIAFRSPGPARALGFGVWPLFGLVGIDGPAAAPFIRKSDLLRIRKEDTWNALT